MKYFWIYKKEHQCTRVFFESPKPNIYWKIIYQPTPNNIDVKVVEYIIDHKKL